MSTSPVPGVTSLNFSPPPTSFLRSTSSSTTSPESHTLPLPTETGLPPITLAETGVPIISGTSGPKKGDLATSTRPEIPDTPVSLASLGGGVPIRRNERSAAMGDTMIPGTETKAGVERISREEEEESTRTRDRLPQYEDAVMQSGDEVRARYEAESILAREREMKQGHN